MSLHGIHRTLYYLYHCANQCMCLCQKPSSRFPELICIVCKARSPSLLAYIHDLLIVMPFADQCSTVFYLHYSVQGRLFFLVKLNFNLTNQRVPTGSYRNHSKKGCRKRKPVFLDHRIGDIVLFVLSLIVVQCM